MPLVSPNGHRGEQSNDRHHNEEFHKCEAVCFRNLFAQLARTEFQGCPSLVLAEFPDCSPFHKLYEPVAGRCVFSCSISLAFDSVHTLRDATLSLPDKRPHQIKITTVRTDT